MLLFFFECIPLLRVEKKRLESMKYELISQFILNEWDDLEMWSQG